MRRITFTMDVEDPRPSPEMPKRYDRMTREVLRMLDSLAIQGTFFIVGSLAKQDPVLVQDIANAGHEVALHSMDHIPLPKQSPDQFRAETLAARRLLQDQSCQEVLGYRAPIFSLTRDSLWATDILKELGFQYSSSVLPAKNPLFGFPGAPTVPFRWPSGLLEIPAPITRLGPLVLPYLGGIYFRYLPQRFITTRLRRASEHDALWLYSHPYDFDAEEPLYRIKNSSWLVSLLLWFRRAGTLQKLERLFLDDPNISANGTFATQIASGAYSDAATFVP